jgi:DNA-binding NtrC family response regulator
MFRVLVIDDDKLIRWSLKEICSQEGHTVDTVGDAEAALKKVKDTVYDVIFADFELENASSMEMLKDIRNTRPGAPIVIISAHQSSEIEAQVQDIDIFKIVEKPFEPELIRSIAGQVRDKHKSQTSDKEV